MLYHCSVKSYLFNVVKSYTNISNLELGYDTTTQLCNHIPQYTDWLGLLLSNSLI